MQRGTGSQVYCIDTSSFIDLARWRPLRQHAQVWRKLEGLIKNDRLISPRLVLEELARRDDELLKWARRHKSMFKRTTPELVKRVQDILRRFPQLVDHAGPTTSADPFVVALAVEQSSGALYDKVIVITEERYPRIPQVCEAYGHKYLTIHQLFMFEGWSF